MRNALLLFVVLGFLIAGCAAPGGPEPSAAPSAVPAPSAASIEPLPSAPPRETIKFGAILPLTGSLASVGEGIRDAMVLAVEEVNQEGGINGKDMELIIEDTGCDPGKAVPAVNKLVSVDQVVAIAGPTCSGESLATASILNDNKIPSVAPSATAAVLSTQGGEYWFRVVPSDEIQGQVAAEYAKEKLASRRAAILYQNNDWGVGLRNAFKSSFKALGGEIATEESMETDVTDVRTQVTRIKRLNADVVYIPCYPKECAVALKQLSELDVTAPVLGADGGDDPDTLGELGNPAEGFIITVPSASVASSEFKSAYKARYGKDAGVYAAQAYDAVKLLAEAARAPGGADGEKIKNYLYRVDYEGASGLIQFDSNGDLSTEGVYDIKKWEDGAFKVLEQVTVDIG